MDDIIYLAGLIDGEGSILLTRNNSNKWRAPVVSISSTTIEMLDFIPKLYGGCISKKKTEKGYLPEFSYTVICDRALKLMIDILPYLRHPIKKKRVIYLIDNYKKVTKRNGKYTEEEKLAKQKFEQGFYLL